MSTFRSILAYTVDIFETNRHIRSFDLMVSLFWLIVDLSLEICMLLLKKKKKKFFFVFLLLKSHCCTVEAIYTVPNPLVLLSEVAQTLGVCHKYWHHFTLWDFITTSLIKMGSIAFCCVALLSCLNGKRLQSLYSRSQACCITVISWRSRSTCVCQNGWPDVVLCS